jgi:hypothetical protein
MLLVVVDRDEQSVSCRITGNRDELWRRNYPIVGELLKSPAHEFLPDFAAALVRISPDFPGQIPNLRLIRWI